MKIYFGEATAQEVEDFGEDGLLQAKSKSGKQLYYYHAVEHGSNSGGLEDVKIMDGIGRSIPIAVDSIPDLITALNECYNNYQIIAEAEALEIKLYDPNFKLAVKAE